MSGPGDDLAADLAKTIALMRLSESVTVGGPLLRALWTEYDRRGAEIERLKGLEQSVAWLRSMVATSSRDWGRADGDALIYGVLVGWGDAIDIVAERFGWGPETVAAVERRRAALAGPVKAVEPARRSFARIVPPAGGWPPFDPTDPRQNPPPDLET